ncbi:hypothetical protein RCO48_17950 [Peribacillus frigoritolerans]|nr:hypothetical protein [Peribacillus frigoritolerans]
MEAFPYKSKTGRCRNRFTVSSRLFMGGGLFLSSAWNPYGNTGKLPVAVVNKDVKAEYEGKTLTVGNELVEQLKDNDDLEWHFVTEKAAKKRIR